MSDEQDKNHVSIGFWMLALFVVAIPCVGWIMIIIWAFTGDNESRKNYFKAILIWTLILVAVVVSLMFLGALPGVLQSIQNAIPKK
jgi:hypothetical protein